MTSSAIITPASSSPIWLKVAAVFGVVWYAFGLLQFWLGFSMDINAAVEIGAISAAHGAAIATTPGLIWLTFAIASLAGLIGSILLFARSARAKTAFAVSLLSAAIYYAWIYGLSGSGADRPSEEGVIACVVGGVTLAFLLLSRRAV